MPGGTSSAPADSRAAARRPGARRVSDDAHGPRDPLGAAVRRAMAALEGAEEVVVVADAASRAILAVNRAGRELLDGRPAVGRPLEWLFPDADASDLRRRVRTLVDAGGRSMGISARAVWDMAQGRPAAARIDVVRRDDVPILVAFVRAHPEDHVLRADRPDALAALPGRDTFLALADAEVRRASRHGRPLSMVAVRLVVPAAIEGSGEAEAAVLAGVAEQLRAVTRAEEPVARVGRLAFAWLLPEATPEGARVAAERARAVGAAFIEAGVRVLVGVAALVPGDSGATLLRRAEGDALAHPGSGGRPGRTAPAPSAAGAALLRASLDGDARAVARLVEEALVTYGLPAAFDVVFEPALARVTRGAGVAGADDGDSGSPRRYARAHRAVAMLEWGVGRRAPVQPPPDAPVAAMLPIGMDAHRLTLPGACDAAASAGWMPVVVQMPHAADLAPPLARLGAAALVAVLGDDTDLLDAGHLLAGLGEALPAAPLFAVGPPGGLLERWSPPPAALPVSSAVLLAELLLHARTLTPPSQGPPREPA